ncbi:MAG TPA: hypothetical protein VFQ85_07840 [Mycobacteriales bacterium]|jgi:hypothetical protein|nr:hypothetical protein [Mycobacteriales bacterium]
MRARLLLALGSAALVAAATVPSHAAGTVVLDGKKVKGWKFNQAVTTQNNAVGDQAGSIVGPLGPTFGGAACTPPRCYKKSFVFKPAKGVKGDLVVKAKWGNPGSDYDLYLYPSGAAENGYIANCGGSASTGEVMVVPGTKLKYGKTYTLVVNFQQSYNDSLTGSLAFPAKFSTKAAQFYSIDDATATGLTDGQPLAHTGCAMDGTLM